MAVLVEDTRQKLDHHKRKHEYFSETGIDLFRCKLPFGDYALPPKVSIDTKEDMGEICNNICGKSHQRFINECKAAKAARCKLIILVENEVGITDVSEVHNWINPRVIYAENCPQGAQLQKAMETISSRYGTVFEFCHPDEAGKRIIELLEAWENERRPDNV